MPEKRCRVCGGLIPEERLEAIPTTATCTEHSDVQAYRGYMIPTASKGCASVIHFVPPNKEAERLARRANRRSR